MKTSAVGIALQPIVDLRAQQRPAHYEALLRIERSTRFGSSHRDLITAAEQEGWIDEVDLAVMCEAVTILRTFPDASLSVNVSPRTIELAGDRVLKFLAACRDVTNRLTIEITETTPIKDCRATMRFIRSAKEQGCRLALDDYGNDSGFISRDLIIEVRPDYLKLDRIATESDYGQKFILPLALDLAHQIGAEIVAEFIDTQEKVELILECGIRYAQGALFGMPKPSADIFFDATASVF